MIYAIFGANFFLFAWVDEVLVYWILSRFVPNMTFLLLVLDFAIFWLVSLSSTRIAKFNSFQVCLLFFQMSFDSYFWHRTMKLGRDSIRFVDPSWNEIEEGALLWPTFFYTLGFVEKKRGGSG